MVTEKLKGDAYLMQTLTENSVPVKLDNPSHFNNRELSWLGFNYRVLQEAMDERNALLDRFKFLSIFSSNLDEFFMVRVAGLLVQVKAGYNKTENKVGLTTKEQLEGIYETTHALVKEQDHVYLQQLIPMLAKEDVIFLSIEEVPPNLVAFLEDYFDDQVFPVLTPMAVDTHRPFPMLLNRSLNLAVVVEEKANEKKKNFPFDGYLVIVQVPSVIERFIELPQKGNQRFFVLLEEVISTFIGKLLAGYRVKSVTTFRITRNADLNFGEDEAYVDDFLIELEEELKKRKRGVAVRLEVQQQRSDEQVIAYLKKELEIHTKDVYVLRAPLDLAFYLHSAKQSNLHKNT